MVLGFDCYGNLLELIGYYQTLCNSFLLKIVQVNISKYASFSKHRKIKFVEISVNHNKRLEEKCLQDLFKFKN